MTPTELWNIYYHAMKKWIPKATDEEVRDVVQKLMKVSVEEVVQYERRLGG